MLQPLLCSSRDHISGGNLAPLQVVQYGDLQCPHCADIYPQVKQLQEILGPRLQYAFRHYPLPQLHPLALDAAIACEMAALQGRFWYMHDIIFENHHRLSRKAFLDFAEEIELDIDQFTDTAAYQRMARKVISDFESGVRSGVDVTPTFFINGVRYGGLNDLEGLLVACNYTLLFLEAR